MSPPVPGTRGRSGRDSTEFCTNRCRDISLSPGESEAASMTLA
jgi:hypothetical protein